MNDNMIHPPLLKFIDGKNKNYIICDIDKNLMKIELLEYTECEFFSYGRIEYVLYTVRIIGKGINCVGNLLDGGGLYNLFGSEFSGILDDIEKRKARYEFVKNMKILHAIIFDDQHDFTKLKLMS